MKISEMNNDQAMEAVIRISTPISNLCDDPEMMELMDDLQKLGDMSLFDAIGKMLPRIVAYALKKHKNDLYEIIGALQMVPMAQVGKMNFAETIKMLRESYDDVLAGFFTDSVRSIKDKGKKQSQSL